MALFKTLENLPESDSRKTGTSLINSVFNLFFFFFFQKSDQKFLSPPLRTLPPSTSPPSQKRNFNPLDLSGIKEEEINEKFPKTASQASSSTQTTTPEAQCDPTGNRTCHHCDISFGDDMMHALHMSCHDKVEPFKCTICGQKCNEKYYFNVHLLRGLHQKPASDNLNVGPQSSVDGTKIDSDQGPRRLSNSSDSCSSSGRCHANFDAGDVTYQ